MAIVDKNSNIELDTTLKKNRWKWDWLEKKDENNDLLGNYVRKLKEDGRVLCIWCSQKFYYRGKGCKQILTHVESQNHKKAKKSYENNTGLGAAYGSLESESTTQPFVSMSDRKLNQQAYVLAFAAENSISFSMIPKLIGFAKDLAQDRNALGSLKMDRTTASYKTKYGVAKTLQDDMMDKLRTQPFSLNADESTNNANDHVLTILASYFNEDVGLVSVEHFCSLSVIKCNAESVFQKICGQIEENDIPWTNLKSTLFDSCNVMRGKYSGVEVRIRKEKAPHLIDIDGDSCHHIHNISKKFSSAFNKNNNNSNNNNDDDDNEDEIDNDNTNNNSNNNYLTRLLKNLFSDFKWSTDLRDLLKEIFLLLDSDDKKCPPRFLSHRWLSIYSVTKEDLVKFDFYKVFYYSFLTKDDKRLYWDEIKKIMNDKEVSSKGKARIKEIQNDLERKQLTKEGKARKVDVTNKLFVTPTRTLLEMNFFVFVLEDFFTYVKLFQKEQPMLHMLHEKQVDLIKKFFSLFIKPKLIVNSSRKLVSLDLDDETNWMKKKNWVLGGKTKEILRTAPKEVAKDFLNNVKVSFITAGKYMQTKLPLRNKVLIRLRALDPNIRNAESAVAALADLPNILKLNDVDIDEYARQVRNFSIGEFLQYDYEDDRLDSWYNAYVFNNSREDFSVFGSVIKTALSIFHGPRVESSFNLMDDIMDKRSTRMDVTTLSAIQTIKYGLKARNMSAKTMFVKKDHRRDPVCKKLANNLINSHGMYIKRQEEQRQALADKRSEYELLERKKSTHTRKKSMHTCKKSMQETRNDESILQNAYKPPIVSVASVLDNQISGGEVVVAEASGEVATEGEGQSIQNRCNKRKQSNIIQHFKKRPRL